MSFKPTDEQVHAIDLARSGNNLTIEALAGSGKTSTLVLIAEALHGHGKYVAFNRKIVDDSGAKFGPNVDSKTAHQLAWKAIGRRFSHQPMKQRFKGKDVADYLGVDVPWVFDVDEATHELHPGSIGALAMETVQSFCRSADEEIGRRHVPIVKAIDLPGQYHNNRNLSARVFPLARRIWEDMKRPHDGVFVMGFNYLKLWQLSNPVIDGEFLLFDEAQDANPVMLSIVQNQDHMQRIYVGDSRQQIYEWNGAKNALRDTDGERCHLTRSFRFGPEIAGAANLVLARLDEGSIEVTGAGPAGSVGRTVDLPDVFLARTNGGVVLQALEMIDRGLRVLVQGGTWEVISFARAAEKLQAGVPVPDHPDLQGFKDWQQVVDYTEKDSLGSDLKVMVRLVEKFGAHQIIQGLSRTVKTDRKGQPIGPVDITVSTAHKSKGAEWGRVRLVDDFMEPVDGEEIPDAEIRLLYVAVTRAMSHLDPGFVSLSGRPNVDALRAAMAAGDLPAATPPVDGQLSIIGAERCMFDDADCSGSVTQVSEVWGPGGLDRIMVCQKHLDDGTGGLVEALLTASDDAVDGEDYVGDPGPPDWLLEKLGPRERQPREMSIARARDELGGKVLFVECAFCEAKKGEPCRIRRGPRAGYAMTKAHTPRVEAAADLQGMPVIRSATA